MFNNIFRKYNFDNLYIGTVTVYKNKGLKPSCVKVIVPPDKDSISYITIFNKLSDNAYLQIDNEQCCFYHGEYVSYSNFPVVENLMSLREYYKNYYKKEDFLFEPIMSNFTRNRIINNATKKVMVI